MFLAFACFPFSALLVLRCWALLFCPGLGGGGGGVAGAREEGGVSAVWWLWITWAWLGFRV